MWLSSTMENNVNIFSGKQVFNEIFVTDITLWRKQRIVNHVFLKKIIRVLNTYIFKWPARGKCVAEWWNNITGANVNKIRGPASQILDNNTAESKFILFIKAHLSIPTSACPFYHVRLVVYNYRLQSTSFPESSTSPIYPQDHQWAGNIWEWIVLCTAVTLTWFLLMYMRVCVYACIHYTGWITHTAVLLEFLKHLTITVGLRIIY